MPNEPAFRDWSSSTKIVNPQALQGAKGLSFRWERGKEDPALAFLGPLGGRPLAVSFLLLRKQSQAIGNQAERSENARALLVRVRINQVGMLGALQPTI